MKVPEHKAEEFRECIREIAIGILPASQKYPSSVMIGSLTEIMADIVCAMQDPRECQSRVIVAFRALCDINLAKNAGIPVEKFQETNGISYEEMDRRKAAEKLRYRS